MTVLAWTLVILFTLNILITIAQVGKPREPISPGTAAVVFLIDGALIIWLLSAGGAP